MNVLRLPELLQPLLLDVLRSHRVQLSASAVDGLQRRVKGNAVPRYDEDAAAFAYLYFGANFTKAYRAVQRLWTSRQWRRIRVLDLGCGAGASTAGVVQALWDCGAEVESICAIDINSTQLGFFRDTTLRWLQRMWPSDRTSCVRDDVSVFAEYANDFDLIVASYLLCEVGSIRSRLDRDLKAYAAAGKRELLLIDSDGAGRPTSWSQATGATRFAASELSINLDAFNDLGCSIPPRYHDAGVAAH